MNTAIDQLAGFVASASIDTMSVDELNVLVSKYPYFNAAQILLAKKQAGSAASMQMASLHLPNSLWLQRLVVTGDDTISSMPVNKIIEEDVLMPRTSVTDDSVEVISNDVIEDENDYPGKPAVVINTVEETESSPVLNSQNEIEPVEAAETDLPDSEEMEANEVEEEIADQPALKIPAFKIEAIDPAKATLAFEPYHTVDYFASLGIKYKEDEKPPDRFTQQLRSFTDWIKTMKKLPPGEAALLQESLPDEKAVEQMAVHSLADQRVVTEAMAEVWEKQGNKEKAADVYRKLSLLDPSKSAYFASKIEHLKKLS